MKTMNDLVNEISSAVAGGRAAVAELAAEIVGGRWQTAASGRRLEATRAAADDAANDSAFDVLAVAQVWANGWACWYLTTNSTHRARA